MMSRHARFSGVKPGMDKIIRIDEPSKRERRKGGRLSRNRVRMTITQNAIQKGTVEKKLNFMLS